MPDQEPISDDEAVAKHPIAQQEGNAGNIVPKEEQECTQETAQSAHRSQHEEAFRELNEIPALQVDANAKGLLNNIKHFWPQLNEICIFAEYS